MPPSLRLALFGAAFILPTRLLAVPVPIANAGFEDLYLGSDVPAGAFPVGPAPSGWTTWDPLNAQGAGGYVGVLNPGAPVATYFNSGAPEGDNAALLYFEGDAGGNAFGIEQTLGGSLTANTTYRLTVQVGNIATGTALAEPYASYGEYDLRGFPGYRIELWAGSTRLAYDENGILPIAEGEFELSTLVYDSALTDPLGQALMIRLINLNQADVAGVRGLEVDFDDVRLDAAPTAVPNPATLALLASGLPCLRYFARRRPAGLAP